MLNTYKSIGLCLCVVLLPCWFLLGGLPATGSGVLVFPEDALASQDLPGLKDLSIEQVFARLTEPRFVYNETRMEEAVLHAFAHRGDVAIEYSIAQLKRPINIGRSEAIVPDYRFDVAKSVLLAFQERALWRLMEEFHIADPLTRANIIRVMSKIDTEDTEIKDLLFNALDDRSSCEEPDPGVPNVNGLRVCDVAYNELILRYKLYKLNDIVKSIGNIQTVEIRNYHIGLLKESLKMN